MKRNNTYILSVSQMKHLKELGLKIELDERTSMIYWVKFIQKEGKLKCHRWRKSFCTAAELNKREPQLGHYIGMAAYTLQDMIEILPNYIVLNNDEYVFHMTKHTAFYTKHTIYTTNENNEGNNVLILKKRHLSIDAVYDLLC